MAACLYDPAFATLARMTGPRYRKAVTALTLFGGFASTVFWPLSHLLLEGIGWRASFGVYAALHLLVCLPIHRVVAAAEVRGGFGATPRTEESARKDDARSAAFGDPRLHWLTAAFAIATFIFAVIAVHMINLLTSAGLTAGEAVTISMLVGPMQVAGRVIELTLGQRVRAITVGVTTFLLMFAAIVALILVDGFGVAAVFFVVAYGFGNGVLTIVRGTAPVELFGPRGVGGLLGYLSRAIMYAKAVAPAAFTGFLAAGLTRNAALGVLAGFAVAGTWTYLMAARVPRAGRNQDAR
jgi:predicted MFS family arabinose efflux permease